LKPFERRGIDSLEAALLEKNYKSLDMQLRHLNFPNSRVDQWGFCCQSKDGLSLTLTTAPFRFPHPTPAKMTCGDILTLKSKLSMLGHIHDMTSYPNLFNELNDAGKTAKNQHYQE